MSVQETLGQKQRRFVKDLGKLIEFAYAVVCTGPDDGITFGEAYRTPEQAKLNELNGKGISNSLHMVRLAVDFNLILKGEYQAAPEPYRPLGEFWKSLGDDHAWGGDFKSRDANHFSIAHQGRR